jgi:hypothetical protein
MRTDGKMDRKVTGGFRDYVKGPQIKAHKKWVGGWSVRQAIFCGYPSLNQTRTKTNIM